jgi:hypothetical protein
MDAIFTASMNTGIEVACFWLHSIYNIPKSWIKVKVKFIPKLSRDSYVWLNLLDQHSRYFIIFFARNGRIRAVEVRPQKFRANFFRFGRISSILQPKNLLNWGKFAQIERNLSLNPFLLKTLKNYWSTHSYVNSQKSLITRRGITWVSEK